MSWTVTNPGHIYLQSLAGSSACIQHPEVSGTHPEAAASSGKIFNTDFLVLFSSRHLSTNPVSKVEVKCKLPRR